MSRLASSECLACNDTKDQEIHHEATKIRKKGKRQFDLLFFVSFVASW